MNEELSVNTVEMAEGDISEPCNTDEENELETMRNELERLRSELRESKLEGERIASEIAELHSLFPEANASQLPDEVKASIASGIPLAAAYALYEKRREAERARADGINRKNASLSYGAAGKNTPKEYFSPDEVRAMSQSEVRANYARIIESMKKWN